MNDSGLANIADCCQRLVDLENEASTLEDQLKHIKEEMLNIRNEKIPAVMQEKNLTQLKLNDGSSIEIKIFTELRYQKTPINGQRRINGFVTIILEILSRTKYLQGSVVTKTERHWSFPS